MGEGEISIETMQPEDLDGVIVVEKLSFPTPWSRSAFVSELTENTYAHYIVAHQSGRVVGYAGMWLILDEAHVTNIAVHPDVRGRGLGARLLEQLILRAAARGAERMTLEVRVSNLVAQGLYQKYRFVARGLRRGYYTDTKEDAIIMWRDPLIPGEPGPRPG